MRKAKYKEYQVWLDNIVVDEIRATSKINVREDLKDRIKDSRDPLYKSKLKNFKIELKSNYGS